MKPVQGEENIDPRYAKYIGQEILPGFNPPNVRMNVLIHGFLNAENPEEMIWIQDLPHPNEVESITFINIYDIRLDTGMAFAEIQIIPQNDPPIPYWGLLISPEKVLLDSYIDPELKEYDFLYNSDEYEAQLFYLIIEEKGEIFRKENPPSYSLEELKRIFKINLTKADLDEDKCEIYLLIEYKNKDIHPDVSINFTHLDRYLKYHEHQRNILNPHIFFNKQKKDQ